MAARRQKQCLATLISQNEAGKENERNETGKGSRIETENGKEIRNQLHTIITGIVLPSSSVLMYGMCCVGTRNNFASKLV
jgi:hypothetical protein